MAVQKLEERVAVLEAEVAKIKKAQGDEASQEPWWVTIRGRFRNDPSYDEAMRYGKEYRESLRQAESEEIS